jgi:hypothetical protein
MLSWGQRELWHVIEQKPGSWLPIGKVVPLPAGTTVRDAVADLRFVMSRYPSMRTRLRLDPDGPKQVVSGSGEIRLEVVDVAEDADAAEVAGQVWLQYSRQDHDFVTDWPLRMAVTRQAGVLTHRVWVMCHLITDGGGSRVIVDELASRDSSGSAASLSPVEQARWQSSPAGQRQCESALRHWEKILRSISPRRFPERTGQPYPRYWEASFNSPALHLAMRVIAARTGVGVSSALLALFTVALARVTGINPVVIVLVVDNRFRPGLARAVSPLIQPGIGVFDIPDGTVDDAVLATRRRAIGAYKYAYHDPPRREELIERVNRERGEQIDLECSLNDRRLATRNETGPVPTPEQVRAALPRTTLTWTRQPDDRPLEKMYVNVDDEPGTVAMAVLTDFHHVAKDDVESCLRGMEEVAVAAALDPTTRTRVAAAAEARVG